MEIELVLKLFFINIYIYLVCMKIINIEKTDYAKIVIISLFTTILYIVIRKYADNMFSIVIQYFIQILFIRIILKNNEQILFTANLIANSIVYAGFVIGAVAEIILMNIFNIKNNLINIMIILLLEGLILFALFKIRRFKHGFSFLYDNKNKECIEIIMMNISSVLIFTYCLFGNYYGNLTRHLIFSFMILVIIMLIMIQKTLTLYYKQKLIYSTIEDSKKEIASKDEQIKKLSDEKFKISKLNHEFYNRQKALEKKVQDFVSNSNAETSSELSVMESINNLSKGYTEELEKIKSLDKLTSTDIEEIDDMFKYMQSECKNNNIDFKLQINGNIHHMVNKLIPQDRLVTLIGDHLRDAIIAINVGDNKFRSILAILGIKDECYELCIYDSGVEFTIDTLSKLGIEQITTHKDSGGSGMGFITTFETMKQTGASLIIDEKRKPSANDYTKAVIIRFDGKNEYRIFSYRSKEIKNKIKNNRAIIKDRM